VTTIREGDLAGLGGRVHFPPGEATMSDDAAKAVRQIAGKIRGFRNIVLVKGHTGPDDLPADMPRTGVEARRVAMQLSLERANLVAELLIEHGVSPDILRVQASGSYEPLRRRAYDATDRLMNRRVEVQATDQLTADRAAQEAVVSP
jgi:outer membrane protein OmpA-like peptidoglycan-associated protein